MLVVVMAAAGTAQANQDKAILKLFPLYAKQFQAIFDPARYSHIESGTKAGKTSGCANWLSRQMWKDGPGDISWWVAPNYAQAELGYRWLKICLPHELCKFTDSRLRVELPNGAMAECKSAEKPDNLFGFGIKRVVIDEASRIREEAWFAIRTTITQTQGVVRMIGNPKGKKNWFWKRCQIAKSGEDPNFAYHHLRSVDNPSINKLEVEVAKRELPLAVYMELYEGIAQDDETGAFRNFHNCIGDCLEGPQKGHEYIGGLDLARLQDYTVLIIMDVEERKVVFLDRFNKIRWRYQTERIAAAARRYNHANILYDATGIGDVVGEDLERMNLSIEPYKFTNQSKNAIISALQVSFEQESIIIPDSPVLLSELEVMEYKITSTGLPTFSAPLGYHDDAAIALALANYQLQDRGVLVG